MLYVTRNPKLNVRIVDGTSLAVAVVLHSIPKGTHSVLLLVGNVSKMALSLCLALCQIDIQVEMVQRDKFNLLKQRLPPQLQNYLVLSGKYRSKGRSFAVHLLLQSRTINLYYYNIGIFLTLKEQSSSWAVDIQHVPLFRYQNNMCCQTYPRSAALLSAEQLHRFFFHLRTSPSHAWFLIAQQAVNE
ncbi:unnamed protein product [Musa acuminata var. zebrina]